MKKQWACAWLLSFWAVALSAQKGEPRIVVPTDPSEGGASVRLCLTPANRTSGEICNVSRRYLATGESVSIQVNSVCESLKTIATREWLVSVAEKPGKMLYRIDCETELALPLDAPSSPPPATQSPATTAAQKPPAPGKSGNNVQEEDSRVNKRLKELEKALAEQKKALQSLREELEKRNTADRRELEKKLDALQRDLQDKLRALGDAQKNSCYRVDDAYKGRAEVTVAVAGSVLRFLEVKPRETSVSIGLSEAKAGELLAEVQARSSATIFPHIYLAVPEAVREVQPFFLQDRLIDPNLYSRLTDGKDASRVSYEDAIRFIEDLNSRCAGRARFALPTEEQLVAVAHEVYDPVRQGLKSCDVLREEDVRSDITELLGASWQLTRSLCETFSDRPKATCPPESSWIRKGGAATSNPLECMPEYRSLAPFDVHQKETSFRLALVVG